MSSKCHVTSCDYACEDGKEGVAAAAAAAGAGATADDDEEAEVEAPASQPRSGGAEDSKRPFTSPL